MMMLQQRHHDVDSGSLHRMKARKGAKGEELSWTDYNGGRKDLTWIYFGPEGWYLTEIVPVDVNSVEDDKNGRLGLHAQKVVRCSWAMEWES